MGKYIFVISISIIISTILLNTIDPFMAGWFGCMSYYITLDIYEYLTKKEQRIRFMKENLIKEMTLEEVAKEVAISLDYLKLFIKNGGLTLEKIADIMGVEKIVLINEQIYWYFI